MSRIIRAREQVEMLAAWHLAAPGDYSPGAGLPLAPDVVMPGFPGQGRQPTPKPAPSNIGDDTPWARHDWRQAVADGSYGKFHSDARPAASGDVPHPSELLPQMRGQGAGPRYLTIEDEATGDKRKVARPGWADMVSGARDPEYDPYGLLPEGETFRQHVENFKERIRRGRDQKSPDNPTDFHSQVQNLRDHIQRGGGNENGGRVWYPSAHDRSKWISDATHGDQDRTIGTDAGLSPLKDWDLNTEQSAHFNLQYPFDRTPGKDGDSGFRVPAPNSQNDKARRILDLPDGATRDDIADVLGGPKTQSFQNNIGDKTPLREPRTFAKAHQDFMDQHGGKISEEDSPYYHGGDPARARQIVPDDHGFYQHKINPYTGQPDSRYAPQDITADTHHVRAHTYAPDADLSKVGYGTPDWFSEKMTIGGKDYYPGYELSSRIGQVANAELNAEEADAHRHTIPDQGQATGWKQWKGALDAAGSAARQPAPGETPKAYDEHKKNWGLTTLNKGTDPRTKKPIPDPDPAPQYQYDRDPDWFHDPRRPQPGPVYDHGQDWEFKPGDSDLNPGHWIAPERATRTLENDPQRRGKPYEPSRSEITHETFDPRASPNWGRRPKDDEEWKYRDYNQYLTDLWGDPGERGRWASVAGQEIQAARSLLSQVDKLARGDYDSPSFRVNSILAFADRLLHISGKPAQGALYVLLPHWDPEACAAILHSHAAAQQGRIAAPVMDRQWMGDVMDAAHQGGFTLHDHVGDGPTDGYMVSLCKDSESKTPMEHLNAEHVRDFVSANADALNRPHNYLGGWLENGHFYLDVSTHVPEMNRATTEAVRNRQLGIYDLKNGRTIHTDEAGWLTGHPGVVGSRTHGQRTTAVSPAAQGRPATGGRHPQGSSGTAADDGPERRRRIARHLDAYLPPGGL